jgi:hypothetical protein
MSLSSSKAKDPEPNPRPLRMISDIQKAKRTSLSDTDISEILDSYTARDDESTSASIDITVLEDKSKSPKTSEPLLSNQTQSQNINTSTVSTSTVSTGTSIIQKVISTLKPSSKKEKEKNDDTVPRTNMNKSLTHSLNQLENIFTVYSKVSPQTVMDRECCSIRKVGMLYTYLKNYLTRYPENQV